MSKKGMILFAFVLMFGLQACKTQQKIVDKEKPMSKDDKTIKDNNEPSGELVVIDQIPSKIDSVEYSKSDLPPLIKDNQVEGNDREFGVKKEKYKVAMLLPFLSQKYTLGSRNINPKSEWALQFFAGMKMAIDQLNAQGVNMEVIIYDTQAEQSVVRTLLFDNANIAKSDFIVGPYLSGNVRLGADYAKEKGIPLLSPNSTSTSISSDNPYYVQFNPSLNTHLELIIEDVNARFSKTKVVLIAPDRPFEKARLEIIQSAQKEYLQRDDVEPMQEFYVDINESYDDIDLSDIVGKDNSESRVFIIPTWESELFVSSILRQLEIARLNGQDFVVYGMPQWLEYENLDYNFIEKLKVHVTSSYFVDDDDFEVRQFKRNFYDQYGTKAGESAFKGFDLMKYVAQQLTQNGTGFIPLTQGQIISMMHTHVNFMPIFDSPIDGDATAPVERYENKYLNILNFQSFKWRKVN